jgi:hypothetical protein
MREMKNYVKLQSQNQKGRHHLADLGLDGRLILKWILDNLCVRVQLDRNQVVHDGFQWRALVNT